MDTKINFDEQCELILAMVSFIFDASNIFKREQLLIYLASTLFLIYGFFVLTTFLVFEDTDPLERFTIPLKCFYLLIILRKKKQVR